MAIADDTRIVPASATQTTATGQTGQNRAPQRNPHQQQIKALQAVLEKLTQAPTAPVPPKSARPKRIKPRRRVTVTTSTAPAGDDHTPWIRLCGHWLETAGFALHKRVDVHVAHGCVVLIPEGDD